MEKKYRIYYSANFAWKVSKICNYIFYELKNPISSYNFQIKLQQTISILCYFPRAGPTYKNPKYHYLVMNSWIILYEVRNNSVELADIFNSKQNI